MLTKTTGPKVLGLANAGEVLISRRLIIETREDMSNV